MEEKSETSQRESQTLPSIPKVPKEKEQKTRLPPMRTVRCTPEKCQPPRSWGKWRRVVFTRPFWCKDPPGRRPAEPRPAWLPAAPAPGSPATPSPAAASPPPGARPTWRPTAFVRPRRPRRRADASGTAAALPGGRGRSSGPRRRCSGRGARALRGAGGRSHLPSGRQLIPRAGP